MQKFNSIGTIGVISVEWADFKEALVKNYDSDYSYAVEIKPPFNSVVSGEIARTENIPADSVSINPEQFFSPNRDGHNPLPIEIPTEDEMRELLTEEEIEAFGGIEEVMQDARNRFWQDLKNEVVDEFDLSAFSDESQRHIVNVKWCGVES